MAPSRPSDPDREAKCEFVRRWFDGIWIEGNKAEIHALIAPDCKIHGMQTEVLVGPDAFLPFWELARRNYRSIEIEIDECLVEGDWVVAFVSARSLHLHSFHPVEITGCSSFKLVDGLCVETHHIFDYLSVLGRCGAIENVDAFEVLFPITEEE